MAGRYINSDPASRPAISRANKEDPDGRRARELDRLREQARQRTNARLVQQTDVHNNHTNTEKAGRTNIMSDTTATMNPPATDKAATRSPRRRRKTLHLIELATGSILCGRTATPNMQIGNAIPWEVVTKACGTCEAVYLEERLMGATDFMLSPQWLALGGSK